MNDEEAAAYNDLVIASTIDPCLGKTFPFEEIGLAHFEMEQQPGTLGNGVALAGAPAQGHGHR